MTSAAALDRTIRWRPLTASGLEHFEIRLDPSGAGEARSTIIGPDGGSFCVLQLSPGWRVEAVSIETTRGGRLSLQADGSGRWQVDGRERPDLAGCIDIDISGSPATNTLPIRRIPHWEIGQPRHFDMAWVDLADLSVRRDGQVYTRLADDRFRYQSVDGTFSAEIAVDADGFVTDYPGLFTRA